MTSNIQTGQGFRVPSQLAGVGGAAPTALIIGSCLSSAIPEYINTHWGKGKADWIPLNNFSKLPSEPPRPIDQYDFQLVQVATRSILREQEYLQLALTDSGPWDDLFDAVVSRLRTALHEFLAYNQKSGILSFVSNFLVPQQNPMGRLLRRNDYRNFTHFFRALNDAVAEIASEYQNVYILDVDEIASSIGKRYIQDDVIWSMAHNAVMSNVDSEFDQQRLERPPQLSHLYESKVGLFVQEMLNELRASYTSIRALNQVKLVVTDLDDTLWRGLVGEGDQLTNEGWPHGYAEALSFLSKRGVLVAAISKNDEDVVRKNWRSIVPIKDFVALKVNWKDKVTNMQEILESVNLLPESVVYIDDNPVERANMNRAFPAMRVLGGHPYELRRILLWSPETQAPHLTDEALRKWEMVSRQIQRENLKRRVSREDFLNSLNVTVDARQILSASDPAFSRALELLNKTNQFNTTGKRWSQQEAAESLRRGVRWYCFACADTFTDYGIVSVVLVGDSVIQQIVLSCRVFGFEVENAILSVLAELENLRPTITVSFKATEKNQVALQSLRDMGFVDGDHGLSIASQRLGSLPKHIKRSR